jgi:hypothetical protein
MGFGPGGREVVEDLDLRSQMNMAKRKPAEATTTGAEVMGGEEKGGEDEERKRKGLVKPNWISAGEGRPSLQTLRLIYVCTHNFP